MRRDTSLRRRITVAYVLLAAVLFAVFASATILITRSFEQELISKRLSLELDRLVQRERQSEPIVLPVGIRLLDETSMPGPLRQWPVGLHEATVDGRALHILVRVVDGERLVLADDQSRFERIERNMFVALAAAFLACLLFALLLGRTTSSRVISPLTALAKAVQDNVGTDHFPSLDATDETGVLARAFTARTDELNRFLMRERLFTGDVSHELRTPLTVVLGAAELLESKLEDRSELAAIAERIRRTAFDMTTHVTALLLLSRTPEAFDAPRIKLTALVEHEMERCRTYLANKPVRLHMECEQDPEVHARPELVAIAVGNLLRNACQFTEEGEVLIELSAHAIVVEDTGPGIPEALRTQLFERFVRGEHESISGSGMGLAIAKRVAEHLGWTLRFEPSPRGGSRFVLTLP